jgi:hypothetical protein
LWRVASQAAEGCLNFRPVPTLRTGFKVYNSALHGIRLHPSQLSLPEPPIHIRVNLYRQPFKLRAPTPKYYSSAYAAAGHGANPTATEYLLKDT